ncbi:1,4-alpha-glucan branching enzyme GlgB [Stratiformator vulcanicus]|uniref:1,4-alpha-glucan branching enzyme GlgB n=1 Tax=Stratiformator vulcanicus TaxID=2527980 RepID=A0A517R6M1_9PLAN|nr:1,4-alpha-glucan branching enzyme GlgB [Stratiformator vulcanicus]
MRRGGQLRTVESKPLEETSSRLARFRAELDRLRRGSNASMYHWLGAHITEHNGTQGTRFAVWAPNAVEVSLIHNANGWTPGQDVLWGSDSGVWSGFIEGFGQGDAYKYAIRTQTGETLEKADPLAFYSERPPATASVAWDIDSYEWTDSDWMIRRASTNWLERPISVYEVHLASWKRPEDGSKYFNYRELAKQLVDYCHEMGFTHLELMPMTEYPFDGSWGYQATGYFAPTSRFGTPEDFMYFVDHCHRNGIGVIMDWVPAHFPTDAHSLARFDGTCLYEHSDPRKGFHPDWNTLIFNYGRNEVRDFLLSSARFWIDKYHIDGLRVDAVASMLYLDYSREDGEWIPNQFGGRENLEALQFLKDMNVELHGQFPGVLTIAEESTSWGGVSHPVYNGGLGFSIKWDMGWMNDTLHYIRREPIHRTHHQNELSFRMVYAFTENFMLPLSHDEVVHGKQSLLSQMPGDYWQKFANLRMMYGYQYTMPGKKLLFMGCEFGQWTEWNHDSELDWALLGHEKHDGLRLFIGDLNHFYKTHRALFEADFDPTGFSWIQADDAQNSTYAFVRTSSDGVEHIIVALNFTPVPRHDYRVGVPVSGFYKEVLNSDAKIYGGSNLGNQGGVYSEEVPCHGREHSIAVTLPPLSIVAFRPISAKPTPKAAASAVPTGRRKLSE